MVVLGGVSAVLFIEAVEGVKQVVDSLFSGRVHLSGGFRADPRTAEGEKLQEAHSPVRHVHPRLSAHMVSRRHFPRINYQIIKETVQKAIRQRVLDHASSGTPLLSF